MDEGISKKFFSDLSRLHHQKPKVDSLIQGFKNIGLNRNKTNTASENAEHQSSDGDLSNGHRNIQHPNRLDAEDCSFFIKTGTCKFGRTCKFNHPVSKIVHVDEGNSNRNGAESSSTSLSRIPCKFYRTGFCKYGESCRFNHSKSEPESSLPQLNILGLPKRWGKKICSFYMRTGICGYGTSCRFHHPQPIFFYVEPIEEEGLEINDDDVGEYVNAPNFSESTTTHVRALQFGSIPCDFNVYQEKDGHSSIHGSTSESPSGGKNK